MLDSHRGERSDENRQPKKHHHGNHSKHQYKRLHERMKKREAFESHYRYGNSEEFLREHNKRMGDQGSHRKHQHNRHKHHHRHHKRTPSSGSHDYEHENQLKELEDTLNMSKELCYQHDDGGTPELETLALSDVNTADATVLGSTTRAWF